MTPIGSQQANRFIFLRALYETTEGDPARYVSMHDLGLSVGLSEEETHDACHFLRQEGLLRQLGAGGAIIIEHEGVRQIENALKHPEKPTTYFPPVNVIHGEYTQGFELAQAPDQTAVAYQQLSDADISGLRILLDRIKELAAGLSLGESERRELVSECTTIEAQLDSPRPKRAILKESLLSVCNIVGRTSGSLSTLGIARSVAQVLSNL